jgi:hypothetical protein
VSDMHCPSCGISVPDGLASCPLCRSWVRTVNLRPNRTLEHPRRRVFLDRRVPRWAVGRASRRLTAGKRAISNQLSGPDFGCGLVCWNYVQPTLLSSLYPEVEHRIDRSAAGCHL